MQRGQLDKRPITISNLHYNSYPPRANYITCTGFEHSATKLKIQVGIKTLRPKNRKGLECYTPVKAYDIYKTYR